jgi:hypothetical protein
VEDKKRDSKSRSYLLAVEDSEFLQSDEMRPLRLALEFSKIDLALTERGIASTIVVFGSSRVISPGARSDSNGSWAFLRNPFRTARPNRREPQFPIMPIKLP